MFLCGQNTIWATVNSSLSFLLLFFFQSCKYFLKVKRLLSAGLIRFAFPAPLCVFAWEPAAALWSQPRAVGICCRLPELSVGETSLILLLCLPLFYLLMSPINCGHRLSFFLFFFVKKKEQFAWFNMIRCGKMAASQRAVSCVCVCKNIYIYFIY